MSERREKLRLGIAWRAAEEVVPGEVVNLGIGIPSLAGRFFEIRADVAVHTENGMIGVGRPPDAASLDPNIIDASKQPVTAMPGTAYFDSSLSFAMIRGGHIDVAIVGALQVDQHGYLANWSVPGVSLGVGGAMDLLRGAKRVIVVTEHQTSTGRPKLVRHLTYPTTGSRPVSTIVTDLAVFDVVAGALHLREIRPGADLPKIEARTEAPFTYDDRLVPD